MAAYGFKKNENKGDVELTLSHKNNNSLKTVTAIATVCSESEQ